MPIWIQKLSPSRGQYRVNIPKDLAKITGLDKARIVEISINSDRSIKIGEYHGKKNPK